MACLGLCPAIASGQTFSTVSVKLHQFGNPGRGGRGANMTRITSDPKRISMNAISAGELIGFAYSVSPDRVTGAPPWLYTTSYDVVGVAEEPVTAAQQRIMLQKVLADRFGLECHHGTREGLVFALVAGKQPKLTKAQDTGPEVSRFAPRLVAHDDYTTETVYTAPRSSLSDLAEWLSGMLGHPVRDETGIEGVYQFAVRLPGPTLNPNGEPVQYQRDDGRALLTAVPGQLGLQLRPERRGKVEILVIDRIHTPSEN